MAKRKPQQTQVPERQAQGEQTPKKKEEKKQEETRLDLFVKEHPEFAEIVKLYRDYENLNPGKIRQLFNEIKKLGDKEREALISELAEDLKDFYRTKVESDFAQKSKEEQEAALTKYPNGVPVSDIRGYFNSLINAGDPFGLRSANNKQKKLFEDVNKKMIENLKIGVVGDPILNPENGEAYEQLAYLMATDALTRHGLRESIWVEAEVIDDNSREAVAQPTEVSNATADNEVDEEDIRRALEILAQRSEQEKNRQQESTEEAAEGVEKEENKEEATASDSVAEPTDTNKEMSQEELWAQEFNKEIANKKIKFKNEKEKEKALETFLKVKQQEAEEARKKEEQEALENEARAAAVEQIKANPAKIVRKVVFEKKKNKIKPTLKYEYVEAGTSATETVLGGNKLLRLIRNGLAKVLNKEYYFDEKQAIIVADKNGNKHFINSNGTSSKSYADCSDFADGFAVVKEVSGKGKKKKTAYHFMKMENVDGTLDFVVDPTPYKAAKSYDEGFAKVKKADGTIAYRDMLGRVTPRQTEAGKVLYSYAQGEISLQDALLAAYENYSIKLKGEEKSWEEEFKAFLVTTEKRKQAKDLDVYAKDYLEQLGKANEKAENEVNDAISEYQKTINAKTEKAEQEKAKRAQAAARLAEQKKAVLENIKASQDMVR